ncbi:nucleoside hydrolase [Pseudalkalibacillus sp. A8]|uniref:nucleoside hydrolase n=1 Tax=Pseudalkalibacillus sp. A8 TaxID=3382641 RepID=UPI0038B489C6
MKNVLLFADPGIDDSLALIYAVLNPEINIVGIVPSYGNVTKEQAVQNVAYLLELGKLENIPIIRGAEGPVSGKFTVFYPEIHGPEGLGPIQPPQVISSEMAPFSDIFTIISRFEGNITVVDIGRNSSLSIAFTLEPAITSMVSSYVLMGGAFLVPGNVTPVAEANVHGDSIASRNVFAKAKNTTLLPLNVTNYAYVTAEMASIIERASQNPYKSLIPKVLDYYIQAYKRMVPGVPGAPVHDVLTLMALTKPEVCNYVMKSVDVQIDGPAHGLTIADFRNRPKEQPAQPENEIKIAMQLNYNLFYEDFLTTMTRKIPPSI